MRPSHLTVLKSKKYVSDLWRVGQKTMTSRSDFDAMLLEAVDRALLALGDTARHAIYHHVKMNIHIKREEIPARLEDFREALRNILGAGVKVVETLIAENLYREMGLDFVKQEDWTVMDYVRNASKQRVTRPVVPSDRPHDTTP